MPDTDDPRIMDEIAARVAKAPRVSLDDIESRIDSFIFIVHEVLTLCVLKMQNGFFIVGKSAPASPENFDEAVGKQFAREDAIRQAWAFEGYLLADRLRGANDH